MYKALILPLITLMAITCGCQKPEPVTNPMSISSASDAIWMACKKELQGRGFSINFQNRNAGIIETRPLISKQWFEFWKNDVVDSDSVWKSSTQTTNRVVTINIIDENPQKVKCTASINKLYTTSVDGNDLTITEDSFVATSQILVNENKINKIWAPAGRDSKLEQAILRGIKKRIEK